MNTIKLSIIFFLVVFSTNSLAYGSTSSSKKACKKPTLTQITPTHLSAVSAEAGFSFQTSKLTLPHSIRVTANKIPVEVNIQETKAGLNVSGKLPTSIKKKYVRIDVDATTSSSCQGIDGWLLKIEKL